MPSYCEHCPRRTGNFPGLAGACQTDGSVNAPILFVGKAPGRDELGRVPFAGRSGALLWGAAQKVGISRAAARVMNVSNCWPCGQKGKSLSDKQTGACWNRFNDEITASVGAKVVVCLGGDALERVTGLRKIDKYRGFLFTPDQLRSQNASIPVTVPYKTSSKCKTCKGEGGFEPGPSSWQVCETCVGSGYKFRKGDLRLVHRKLEVEPILPPNVKWIIATYEPMSVMRAGKKTMRAFMNDLDRAARALTDELEIKRYTFATSPRPLSGDLLAFDIENPRGAVDRIGLATDHGIWTGEWNHETREAARYELGDADRIKAAHNIQHDLKYLEAEGVQVPGKIFDTMWAGMVLEPDLPMGLRSMAPLWLDLHGCWKDEGYDKRTQTIGDPEFYNAHDAGITLDLAKVLIDRHRAKGSYESLMRFIMPSLRVLLDMHRKGMGVDLAWLGGFSRRLNQRGRRLQDLWRQHHPSIDPRSNQEVARLLYGELGLPTIKDPDNENKPTTAAWALKLLIHSEPQHRELLRTLLALRKIEKLEDACNLSLGPDGAVHPHFGPQWKDERDPRSKRKGTTSTLRLAVAADSGLNMQQIPDFARRMYIAPPGYTFIKADIDRAEPWVYAALSGDEALIRELENGDPYLRVSKAAGCDRDAAKALFLARFYGARERKGGIILAKRGIPTPPGLVERVFSAIALQYPRAETYRNMIAETAASRGWLQSGFGFVREFMGGAKDIPEAMDWVAQHNVAMILWSLFIPLHELAKSVGGWLALTVYDEVLLCVPTEAVPRIAASMVEIMTSERPEIARGFRPRVSEVLSGQNWRDMSPLLRV